MSTSTSKTPPRTAGKTAKARRMICVSLGLHSRMKARAAIRGLKLEELTEVMLDAGLRARREVA